MSQNCDMWVCVVQFVEVRVRNVCVAEGVFRLRWIKDNIGNSCKFM